MAFAILGNAVLIPVALFYLLMDWDGFVARALEFVPPRMRTSVDSFTHEADAVLGQYLRGQLLVMLILAVYYSVGLALFGLDLALPIGIFTGLAIFVPYLGFGFGLMLAILAGLLEFATQAGPLKAVVMVTMTSASPSTGSDHCRLFRATWPSNAPCGPTLGSCRNGRFVATSPVSLWWVMSSADPIRASTALT